MARADHRLDRQASRPQSDPEHRLGRLQTAPRVYLDMDIRHRGRAPLRPNHPTRPRQAQARGPFIATAHGHYADLRQRLDSYASQLATEIDESRQVVLGGSTPSGAAAAVGCAIMTA